LASGRTANKKITIKLKEKNTALLRHFYCKITGGGKVQEGMTNEEGLISFKPQTIDTLELAFEFCPEKKSVFSFHDKIHNNFTFSIEPWLMEVFFQNFYLHVTGNGMEGPHPLSDKTSSRYEKQR
jgi:hypothetical protein